MTQFKNIIRVNGPDPVAELLVHWTSIEMSQVQILLGEEKFLANPKRFTRRVAFIYHNIALLSKEHQDMIYMMFRKLNIERT